MEWLSSARNPPVRYLAARDLWSPRPAQHVLAELRARIQGWEPLGQILALQRQDGSFGTEEDSSDARATFWALCLMQRCGLDVGDEPVARAVEHLGRRHLSAGALSYTGGGSGVLPCYLGVATASLIKMGALDSEIVRSSVQWLVDHQRFDHKAQRAGGAETWPYRAPANFGCWGTVSCFHGVAGAFQALAAIPAEERTDRIGQRLEEAIEYLRIHRLYRGTTTGRPLFQFMARPFLVGDYRSDLLDLLEGIADADPALIREDWVQAAVQDMRDLAPDGRVTLAMNYGKRLVDPIPLEPLGRPSRFLTYQWILIERALSAATPG